VPVSFAVCIFGIASSARRFRSAASVYSDAIAVPRQPKIAFSCATVAPFSAARVAPILRQPCADLLGIPAAMHASLKALPNDSLVSGLPLLPQMKASSPIGPASSVPYRTGRIGSVTIIWRWLFSVPNIATPSRTCWRPITTASPRRKPVNSNTSSQTRSFAPMGHRS